jgi:DNA polymerase-3 subunit gamma/tau
LEIDGASHTGVDDVRQLRETLGYSPQRSRFKVYIIDEVHMLSQSAFNALLKSLEEPPTHVVFVFATTDLPKVPQTIQSRCLTFKLPKLSASQIELQFRKVLGAEGLAADSNALQRLAKAADGSMRDGLTLLDQAIAIGNGQVDERAVRLMFGGIDPDTTHAFLTALLAKDSGALLRLVEQLDSTGCDLRQFVEDVALACRAGFLLASDAKVPGIDATEATKLKGILAQAKPLDLNRLFRALFSCLRELDGSGMDRAVIENNVLEWCLDPGLPLIDDLMQSIGNAPTKVASRGQPMAAKAVVMPPVQSQTAQPQSAHSQTPTPTDSKPGATAVDVKPAPTFKQGEFPSSWAEFLEQWKRLKPLQARKLEEVSVLEFSPEQIRLAVAGHGLAGQSLLKADEKSKLQQMLQEMIGFKGKLSIVALAELGETPRPESELERREKAQAQTREDTRQKAIDAPLTQEILKKFAGNIESVTVHD